MLTCISNPPYNMKWNVPPFAQVQERFSKCAVPPANNANYAFILTALEKADRAAFILPCGILSTDNKNEKDIRKYLIDNNLIESVITCPDRMFESTQIPVCIITLDKNKDSELTELIDMRNMFEIEKREQNGQFGGNSHTCRTYVKDIKVFNEEHMQGAIKCIQLKKDIKGLCHAATMEEIKEDDYILTPARYVGTEKEENVHRSFDEIIEDINRITRDKNIVKITLNRKIARELGVDILKDNVLKSREIVKSMNETFKAFTDKKIIEDDYFTLTENKEIKIENKDKEKLSEMIPLFMLMWKQHIIYLNNEQNRYLAELRDAILPELMSGNIDLSKIDLDNKNDDEVG